MNLRHATRWRISPGMLWVPLAGVIGALISNRNWGPQGGDIPWLGAAIIGLALLPLLRRIALRYRGESPAEAMPFLPILGVICAVYYGAPVLLQDCMAIGGNASVPVTAVYRASLLCLLGVGAMLATYHWLPRRRFGAPLRLPWDPTRARTLAAVLCVIGLLVNVSPALQASLWHAGQLTAVLRSFLQLGLGILFILHHDRQLGRFGTCFLFCIGLPLLVLVQIGTGSTANVAYVALFFCMVAWAIGRRVPLFALLITGLFLCLLRSSANEFRDRAWRAPDAARLTQTDKTRIFLEIVGARLTGDAGSGPGIGEQIGAVMAARTNQLATLAHVVDWTPRVVPYWRGESYQTLAASFIPRILWPEKPSKVLGQEFGHRYRILAPGDHSTSINLPLLVEFYANFGAPGVVLGMMLLGLLYRLLDVKLNDPSSGRASFLIAAQVMTRLFNIESDFSLTFGAILYQVLLLYFLFGWLGDGARRRERRGGGVVRIGDGPAQTPMPSPRLR